MTYNENCTSVNIRLRYNNNNRFSHIDVAISYHSNDIDKKNVARGRSEITKIIVCDSYKKNQDRLRM